MRANYKKDNFVSVTDDNFNEQSYLDSNPDIAQAVLEGRCESGRAHYELFGRREDRKIRACDSSNIFKKVYSVPSRAANALFTTIERISKNLFKVGSILESKKASQSRQPLVEDQYVKRNRFIREYIKGNGIEIGALHNPIIVPEGATVRYVDRLNVEDLRNQYPELEKKNLVNVDIIDDGEQLDSVDDGSQDFVIANHFLEHCQNPIRTIENMLRVLNVNGILFMAIPDKRFSFDIDRPVTSYEHLEKDYAEGPEWSKKKHFEEWARLVDKIELEMELDKRVQQLLNMNYSIHFHVWTQNELIELMLNLKKRFTFEIEMVCQNITEVVFIIKKT